MKGVVTVSRIDGFRERTDGFRTKVVSSNLRLVSGADRVEPLSYLATRNVYPYYVDYDSSSIFLIETNREIAHNQVGFFYEELQSDAKQLIKADLEEFLLYVDQLDRNKDPEVIFIHHPGRCGSTLLHKLLGSHADIASFSEDLIFENVLSDRHEELSGRVLRGVVRFIGSKSAMPQHRKLVFKLSGNSFLWFEALIKALPQARHVYLTHNAVRIAESFLNLGRGRLLQRLLLRAGWHNRKYVPYSMTRSLFHPPALSDPFFDERQINREGKQFKISLVESFVLTVLIKDRFFKLRENDLRVLILQYRDILAVESLAQVLNPFLGCDLRTGIDEEIYKSHSQSGTIADLSGYRYYHFKPREQRALEAFIDRMSR